MAVGTLHFFCGKMGAGKSTRANALAKNCNGILISEDEWLALLYPDRIHSVDDYREYSLRMKPLLKEHIRHLVNTGLDVVLDFPANTPSQRVWLKKLCDYSGAAGELTYIKASDETCLERIARRREEQPKRRKFDTDAVFYEVTSYFKEPSKSEGFTVNIIEADTE